MISSTASSALELLLFSTVGISLRHPKKHNVQSEDEDDFRECQRELAAFDVRLAEATEKEQPPPPVVPEFVPVLLPPTEATPAKKQRHGTADKSKSRPGTVSRGEDATARAITPSSSAKNLPDKTPAKKDVITPAAVAALAEAEAASQTAKDEDEENLGYLRCTLKDKYSDLEACSLDWCTELHEIVAMAGSVMDPSKLRAAFRNVRLTKLDMETIDKAFASLYPQLERIDVSDNELRVLEHLPPSMLEVDAYKNHIAKVNISCENLVHLGLGLNSLQKCPNVPSRLLSLDLSYNQIIDFPALLTALQSLSDLRHLFLIGNPITLCRGYRHALLTKLPTLVVVDDIALRDNEREIANSTPLVSQDNPVVDLSITITVMGLPEPSETTPQYESTLELAPAMSTILVPETSATGNYRIFESPQIPLKPNVQLRDSIKFDALIVRVFEVPKPDPTAPDAITSPVLRLSMHVELAAFLKPASLEHNFGEISTGKAMQLNVISQESNFGGDYQLHAMDQRRKRAMEDEPPTAKRCKANEDEEIKQEDEESVPDKQLRERNKALRGALVEKNYRLTFLEAKCHELFAHRHAFDGRFQVILNHWSSLLNTLHVLLPDSSRNIESELIAIADMDINVPTGIKCEIDEWFQAGTEPTLHEQAVDAVLDGKLHEQCDYIKAFVNRLLETTTDTTKVEVNEALARAIEEKTTALRTLHATKDELNTYKRQVQELKRDLDRKEVERHQVCREFERLKQGNTAAALPTTPKADGKQPALETTPDASTPTVDSKETLEKIKQLENDLRKATAAESVIRHSMESTKALAEEQYARLYNEHINLKEEYSRFKVKCKDMEVHIHDKWKKKFAKYQADSHKMKSKIDELAVKNAELRSRIVTYTSYKEQMREYQKLMASYERQVASLQEQLKGTEKYRQYVVDAKANFESSTVNALKSQLDALEKSHEALQADIKSDELKQVAAHEKSLRVELAAVQNKLVDTETALDSMTRQLELRKDAMVNHEAELNSIVGEVDAVNREMEALRSQMKKTLSKLNEKENAMAKLAQTNIKLEQANAVSFDELAGVRLQVAALQGLQKQHKALEQGFNDVMKQKENELLSLQAYVNDVLRMKDDAEKERIRILREFQFYQKTTTAPIKPEKPETPPPCEKCQEREAAEQEKPKEGTKEMTELERFELNDLRKKLRCSVCQDAVKDVIISKCSHMFCKECMDNNLKARNRKCPTCKKMFGQDDLKSVWWT
ncbi:hypothetical protein THRCLA_05259 [Thraustotheca clavata]|uniref:E3 ubiquitin protein ligase n=1 Tax=Thraustotheca clavata TaxID=74557 RepID=A0A1V9ZWF7_9STRA|nr:hypothetical protein THRCLA_05259 [Thraustotheca clavata]